MLGAQHTCLCLPAVRQRCLNTTRLKDREIVSAGTAAPNAPNALLDHPNLLPLSPTLHHFQALLIPTSPLQPGPPPLPPLAGESSALSCLKRPARGFGASSFLWFFITTFQILVTQSQVSISNPLLIASFTFPPLFGDHRKSIFLCAADFYCPSHVAAVVFGFLVFIMCINLLGVYSTDDLIHGNERMPAVLHHARK